MQYSKKTLSEEEKIATTIDEFKERIQSKQKTLVYIAVAAIFLIMVVSGGFLYVSASNQKAQEYEAEGYRFFYAAGKDNPSENYNKALEAFKRSYDAKKTAYALLYIANCYEGLGKVDDAIRSLEELVSSFNDIQVLSIAYNKLSALYIKKGDVQRALDSVEKINRLKGGFLQDFAYFQSAAILETMGKTEEARLKYKDLTDKYPNSPFAQLAKKKLEPSK
ncbi:MAG: tetratricopeptide repeat protein [Thermodesulfovibrionales bacterium]|nr:tetratricopeptide repeat protein [Thermodesulfovibrionales bacterium]